MSYQDVKDKLYYGHRKIANNTYLCLTPIIETDGSTIEAILMTLHCNTVAAFYQDHLELYSTGWYTTTTKVRLNLALELANIKYGITYKHIYQEDYQWYYGNYHKTDPRFYDGMKIDYTGKVIH